MRPKFYAVLEMAIDQGVDYGIRRAYKHNDQTPPTSSQADTIKQEVLNVIYEWFDLPEEAE